MCSFVCTLYYLLMGVDFDGVETKACIISHIIMNTFWIARNGSCRIFYIWSVVKYHFRLVEVFSPLTNSRLTDSQLLVISQTSGEAASLLVMRQGLCRRAAFDMLNFAREKEKGFLMQETFIMSFCPREAEYCVFTALPWCCHICFHVRSTESLSAPHQGQIYFTKADPHL